MLNKTILYPDTIQQDTCAVLGNILEPLVIYVPSHPLETVRNIIHFILGKEFFIFNDRAGPEKIQGKIYEKGLNIYLSAGVSGSERSKIQNKGFITLDSYLTYYIEQRSKYPERLFLTEGNCIEISNVFCKLVDFINSTCGTRIKYEVVYDGWRHAFIRLNIAGKRYLANPDEDGFILSPERPEYLPHSYEIIKHKDIGIFMTFYHARILFCQNYQAEALELFYDLYKKHPLVYIGSYLQTIHNDLIGPSSKRRHHTKKK